MRKMIWSLAALVLLAGGAERATAQCVFTDDPDVFAGWLDPDCALGCNTFPNEGPSEASPKFYPRPGGSDLSGYSYRATTSSGNNFYSIPGLLSTDFAGDCITFDQFLGPCDVTAISANVWNTDINFNTIPGIIMVTMDTGDTYIIPAPGGPNSFVGVCCASPIGSITFCPDPNSLAAWVTVTNFCTGACLPQ